MLKELKIQRVNVITRGTNPVVVLNCMDENGKPVTIVRNVNQAREDLINSGRIPATTKGFNELTQMRARELAGKKVYGDIKPFKEGEEYVVNEFSSVLTDETHPQYGKLKIGQKAKHLTDGVWVEGFLDIPLSSVEIERRIARLEEQQAKLALLDSGYGMEEEDFKPAPHEVF